MAEIVRLEFDGIQISAFDSSGNVVAHSIAMSGNNGRNSPGLQGTLNVGPLPEGTYSISATDFESRYDLFAPDNMGWANGFGSNRVTLVPSEQTAANIFALGRTGGFFLHNSPNGYGSAGCIDLADDPGGFFALLRKLGADKIELKVEYAEYLYSNQHPYARCFPAATSIVMSDGRRKAIKDIKVGDVVMAYNATPGFVSRRAGVVL